MTVLRNNEINETEWRNFIHSNDFTSPFQTPEYYHLYNSEKEKSAEVFALKDNKIKALVVVTIQQEKGLKKYFSKRGVIFGGPVLTDRDSSIYLLNFLHQYYKHKLIFLESRNNQDYTEFSSIYQHQSWGYLPYLNYILKIDQQNDYFSNFTSEKRRQIRKAIKTNTTWEVCKDLKDVVELYKIMNQLYKTKVKKPLPHINFFKNLFQMFNNNGNGVVIVVRKGENVIGGSFCPIYNDTIYDWYRAGLDKEYKHSYPSTFAAFAGMEYGKSTGLNYFDFMGAGLKNESYGVRKFKEQFGGQLVEHGRYLLIIKPFMFKLGKFALTLSQKLK